MNTPSHVIMAAALRKYLRRPLVGSAFLLGAVAPDIPLYLLSIGGVIYYRSILGWSSSDTFHRMFDYLYFHHPFWIASHNLLHAPTFLLLALACLWRFRHVPFPVVRWLFWFLLACLLHSIVDVLTHVDDGPLLFFPFIWTIRFHSPISYWDSTHYGNQFAVFELILDTVLLAYLYGPRLWRWMTTWPKRRHGIATRRSSR